MGHSISVDEMTIRRNSYKCYSDSTVVQSNDVSMTHLSDPHALKTAEGLRDGRPSITVVPTHALVVYQCDWKAVLQPRVGV